jgi:hypothetical protein
MTVVLSTSASKRAHYLLPAYPAFALLIAQWWPEAPARRRAVAVAAAIAGPILALGVLGLDPARMNALVASHRRALPPADVLAHLSWSAGAWGAAAALAALGVLVVFAGRSATRSRSAAPVVAYLTILSLFVVEVGVPRFNAVSSARAWGERLAALADRGVRVVAFHFPDSLALSPFMFYAGRRLPETDDPKRMAALLGDAPACVLLQEPDLPRLRTAVAGVVTSRGSVGAMEIVLLETAPGACESAADGAPRPLMPESRTPRAIRRPRHPRLRRRRPRETPA